MKPKLSVLLPVSIAALVVISTAFFFLSYRSGPQRTLPVYGTVPDFKFEESRGEVFGRRDMQGHVNVVDFIFTRCKTACPTMSARMAELYRHFQNQARIQLVSITVDPENDTPEVLQNYARQYGVTDHRWVFLWAPSERVKQLAEKGFKVSGGPPMMHSTKLILVDATGQIRGYYDPFDEISFNQLKLDLQYLVKQLP